MSSNIKKGSPEEATTSSSLEKEFPTFKHIFQHSLVFLIPKEGQRYGENYVLNLWQKSREVEQQLIIVSVQITKYSKWKTL
jgi:hypothetical protein